MEELKAYYDALASERGEGGLQKTTRHWYALQAAGEGRRVLDVGFGSGLVLQELKGRFKERYGTEMSFPPFASELLKQGIKLKRAGSGKLPFRDGYFDLVVSLDVVEHVFDPLSFMKDLRRVLGPGGRVIVTTPNVRYFRQIFRILVQGLGPQTSGEAIGYDGGHLHYFTTRDLLDLAKAAGFRNARVEGTVTVWGHGKFFKRILMRFRSFVFVRDFFSGAIMLLAEV
jgi:SAM-dependent methyltransferase